MIFYCRHCIHLLDYGLSLRLHLSNQVHEPCIRSSTWVTLKRICNFSLNKISRIFTRIFFYETSNIICTLFFLPRNVEYCCLSLNATYSAIMKLFFEGHQASFVSISYKVKRAGKNLALDGLTCEGFGCLT